MSRRFYLILMLPALLVMLAACATMNTTSDGRDKQLMLKGYDPVAYFTERRPVLGDPAITATHDALTYRFSTAQSGTQCRIGGSKQRGRPEMK